MEASESVDLLLAFLRERDVPCPACGYNLRNLTRPQCPECRKELVLAVGLKKPRFGWFLVTITPGLFSGIAAVLLLMPIIIVPLLGGGPAPWRVVAVDAFGWLSGFAVLVLLNYRFVFLRQPQAAQRTCAVVAWGIHLIVLLGLIALSLL
ncbi:MAG: hypothetical protein IH830_08295 [Planctomycetes bacterium]|nr:hypothetical protein [Planctomycetota bacterium]